MEELLRNGVRRRGREEWKGTRGSREGSPQVGRRAQMGYLHDVSAKEGTTEGGAAAVVTKGRVNQPEQVEVRREAAGMVTSSFKAEARALRMAVEWLEESTEGWETAVVGSDSQAGLLAVKRAGPGLLDEVAKVVAAGQRLGKGARK